MKSFTQLLPNRDARWPTRLPSNITGSLHLPSFSHSEENKHTVEKKLCRVHQNNLAVLQTLLKTVTLSVLDGPVL